MITHKQRHLLHIFPSFGIGGVPLRMVRIINHLGSLCRHTILALDGSLAAGERISEPVETTLVAMVPDRSRPVATLLGYCRYLAENKPDILLTYNWGAIEWAAANRVWARRRHIHLESGFGIEESSSQLRRRVLARRFVLPGAEALVVPSRNLERIALNIWRLPRDKLHYIPNGIDVAALGTDGVRAPRIDDAIVIGTVAPLRPEKNVGRLIRAFAALGPSPRCRLVIVGDGAERKNLQELAADLGVADRVTFVGQSVVTGALLAAFDIFGLSSDTEQMPNAILEAMAAGLPIAAVDVGDVRVMVSAENQRFLVPRDDLAALTTAIASLAADPQMRRELGAANRQRVDAEYRQERMFMSYAKLLLS